MQRHDQRFRSLRQPLLLNFVRAQPARDVEYRYIEGQHLNIVTATGLPVVASGWANQILKTAPAPGPGED